jgi:hypothetical protein
MTASIAPSPKFQPMVMQPDGTVAPLPGGKVYTYGAGTTTPLTTFKQDGVTSNTNPIILDTNGSCDMWLIAGAPYKINVTDAAGTQQPNWPVDNIWTVDGNYVAGLVTQVYTDFASTANGKGDALLGVKLNATGSTARTQHSKNGERVSILDFGGLGDGFLDNTTAITAALAYLTTLGGGALYFPSGVYNAQLFIVPSNITLYGDGISSHLKCITPTQNHFICVRGRHVRITGLYLDGNISRIGSNTTGSTISIATDIPGVAYSSRTYDVTVDHCTLDTNGFDTIGGWDCNDVNILFNEVLSGRDTSVDFTVGSYDINIVGNHIYAGALFPIALDTADELTYFPVNRVSIRDNWIYCDSNMHNGIDVESVINCVIQGNHFIISGGLYAIHCLSDFDYVTITDNTFEFLAGSLSTIGISVDGTGVTNHHYIIENNIMKSAPASVGGAAPIVGTGIQLYYTGGSLRNNVMIGLNDAIQISSGNQALAYVLERNMIDGCKYGVLIQGNNANVSSVKLVGNLVTNCTTQCWAFDTGYNPIQLLDQVLNTPVYNGGVKLTDVSEGLGIAIAPNAANNATASVAPNVPTSYMHTNGYIQLCGSFTPNGATTIAANVKAGTLDAAHTPNRTIYGTANINAVTCVCYVNAFGFIYFGTAVTTGQIATIDSFNYRKLN